MRHLGKFDLSGNTLLNMALFQRESFPLNPRVGSLELIRKRVMICLEAESLPVWVPLTNELNMYVHTQDVASDVWLIPHGMHFSTPLVQVFDATGEPMAVETVQVIDTDTVQVTMLHASAGRAIIISGNLGGLPKEAVAYAANYTSQAVWTVNHGLGYNPRTEVYVGGYEVQPQSVVHNSNMTLTVTFDEPVTGNILCF